MIQVSVASSGSQVRDANHPQQQLTGLIGLLLILAVACGLRVWKLGSLSFWYDEVVTMRLAQAPGPLAIVDRLNEIDATRAPLHPILLQTWIKAFGSTEASARSLSVLFGVATIALVWWIGRMTFDPATGLWAAWLAAVSPLLVYYSREARMYALLVMLSCLCWGLLLSLKTVNRKATTPTQCAYILGLAALIYTHPLGLLMAGALALASLVGSREFFTTRRRWLRVHAFSLLLAAPWLRRYFDHPPEFLSGRLPIKFLLGTPIGFVGGNALVLLGLAALAAFGLVRRRSPQQGASSIGLTCLLIWLILPPGLLYLYSWVGTPIFGPARYTLFVAPAYLVLVAQGLAQLPIAARSIVAGLLLFVSGQSLMRTVYAPGLKADWRAFASTVSMRIRDDPDARITVIVRPPDPSTARNVEVETARYYLPERCRVIGEKASSMDPIRAASGDTFYLAVGVGSQVSKPQDRLPGPWVLDGQFPGLAVYRVRNP
jgi:uncharacterized membrane protein